MRKIGSDLTLIQIAMSEMDYMQSYIDRHILWALEDIAWKFEIVALNLDEKRQERYFWEIIKNFGEIERLLEMADTLKILENFEWETIYRMITGFEQKVRFSISVDIEGLNDIYD